MKSVSLVLVAALTTGSCAFAQKHPAVTIGLVAGTIGFGTCGLAVDKLGTCAVVGLGAGFVLGGITGLVTTFADTSAHQLPSDEEPVEPIVRVRSHTAPPPGPPPGSAPVEPSAPPAAPVDAGVPAPVDAP
jgi:hypothetical protein